MTVAQLSQIKGYYTNFIKKKVIQYPHHQNVMYIINFLIFKRPCVAGAVLKKLCIQKTLNLLTNADSREEEKT